MKSKELISIKVRNIKYDVDNQKSLPVRMTVKAHPDMFDIIYYDSDDEFRNLDMSEYIGELIEERVGEPVIGFEYQV